MAVSDIYPLWRNDAGFTMSAAANQFPEVGGSARCSLVPEGNWVTAGAGTLVTGESPGTPVNNAGADWVYGNRTFRVGTAIRGYPALRREHLFEIPCEGYDKLFLQWRGEVVNDATGMTLHASAPADVARTWWGSTEFGFAVGSLYDSSELTYMRDPRLVTWNTANYGKFHSTMTGVDASSNEQAIEMLGGMPLVCRNFYPMDAGNSDNRTHMLKAAHQRLPWQHNQTFIGQGGLLWGYTERVASVNNSRYPKAGDKLDTIIEIGYPTTFSPQWNGSSINLQVNTTMGLSISGLSKVWGNILFNAPSEGASAGFPGGAATAYLEFDTSIYTVRGSLVAKLVRLGPRSW
jgi:hypothetical protein